MLLLMCFLKCYSSPRAWCELSQLTHTRFGKVIAEPCTVFYYSATCETSLSQCYFENDQVCWVNTVFFFFFHFCAPAVRRECPTLFPLLRSYLLCIRTLERFPVRFEWEIWLYYDTALPEIRGRAHRRLLLTTIWCDVVVAVKIPNSWR